MDGKYHRRYQKERLTARKLDSHLLKRLLYYLAPYKPWLALALVFLFLGKIIEAYVPAYIGQMTQMILASFDSSSGAKEALMEHVIHGTLWMIALLAVAYAADVGNVFIKSWLGQKAIYAMRVQVYRHILRLPLAYYDRAAVGRLMTRTIHDIDQIDLMFTDSVVPFLGNLFLFFCIAVSMALIDWRAGIMIVFILPLLAWVLYTFRLKQRSCYEMIRAVVSAMNTFIQEHLAGMSTIHNFGLEKKEKRRFEEINEDYCQAYFESTEHFGFLVSSIDFLSSLTLVMVFIAIVSFAPPGSGFQVGTYFTFSLYVMMLFRPLIDVAERYNVLQSAFAASERVFDILDQPEEAQGPEQGPDLHGIESIEFEDVWFAYDKEHWVLKGLNLRIEKGESLAIVGITGAGKSSIMGLLLRLYDYQKGSIKVNGKEIREYSLRVLRRQFSMVFQDPVLFSGTLEENIALYDKDVTPEMVEEAVDFVNLRAIVEGYPDKLKHRMAEQGKSLSMGEKQLVSMARAVAHQRSVFLFDEATSNVDTGTEKIIQEALDRILMNKTAVVIAHRLSTIKNARRIIVLHNGVLVESGTHAELILANGLYEKLYRLQYMSI